MDAKVFYERFAAGAYGKVEAVFHEGACSDTMELNGKYMMDNNYRVSCDLFTACQAQGTRLLYASSAATYGGSDTFIETPAYEHPLNVYGYSKLLFDQRLRHLLGTKFENTKSQVVGFRYFNVYGNREQHKGRMASVAFHQFNQFKEQGHVKLFGEYGGYAAGMQQRDFVYIDDVVAVNLWFFDNPARFRYFQSRHRPRPTVQRRCAICRQHHASPKANPPAHEVQTLEQLVTNNCIQYIPFPAALVGKYQCHTQADLTALRAAGCDHVFADVSQGVSAYIQQLASK